MKQVLIIDDDEELAALLALYAERAGFGTTCATALALARVRLSQKSFDLILLDMRLPDGNGLDFLNELKARHASTPVIMVTGELEIEHAVRAMRSGAADFLTKPVDGPTITRAIKQATGTPAQPSRRAEPSIVGDSPELRHVFAQLDIFARTDITVLLLGESGTGKELHARAVHARSKRSEGPFIELDCASIAPSLIESELFGHEKGAFTDAREARAGSFELASGGTLFLDEIGNLSFEVQAKLLRVVQERRFRRLGGAKEVAVDVRIVAATNLDIEDAARTGAFRQDLFFRLAELPLHVPALRERTGDVRRLVEHFVTDFATRYERPVPLILPAAMRLLESYSWPGNIRELLNVVRVAVLRATDRLGVEALPVGFGSADFSMTKAHVEPAAQSPAGAPRFAVPWPQRDEDGLDLKKFLAEVRADLEVEVLSHLHCTKGMSKAKMARYLSLDYKVLFEKLRLYGLTKGGAPIDEP